MQPRSVRHAVLRQRACCLGIEHCLKRWSTRKRMQDWHRFWRLNLDEQETRSRRHWNMRRPLVTKEMTREASRQVRDLGARPAMVKLSWLEPALISHVELGMKLIWRKLRSYGLIKSNGMNGI